ncbi:hypothetical protein D3C86_1374910 [compost metagenome]
MRTRIAFFVDAFGRKWSSVSLKQLVAGIVGVVLDEAQWPHSGCCRTRPGMFWLALAEAAPRAAMHTSVPATGVSFCAPASAARSAVF